MPLAPTPTRECHQDTQHPWWQVIWDSVGGPIGRARQVRPHAPHQSEDLHDCILSESAGLQHCMFDSTYCQCRWSSGRCGAGIVGPANRMKSWFDRLLRAKCGKMRGHQRHVQYPGHHRIPPTNHAGPPTWSRGGIGTLLGPRPYLYGRPQRGLGWGPKPAQPARCWHAEGIWPHLPDATLPEMAPFLPPEDFDTGPEGHRDEGEVW